MSQQFDLIEIIADAMTFAAGAVMETTVGAREPAMPSDWAEEFIAAYLPARRLKAHLEPEGAAGGGS